MLTVCVANKRAHTSILGAERIAFIPSFRAWAANVIVSNALAQLTLPCGRTRVVGIAGDFIVLVLALQALDAGVIGAGIAVVAGHQGFRVAFTIHAHAQYAITGSAAR